MPARHRHFTGVVDTGLQFTFLSSFLFLFMLLVWYLHITFVLKINPTHGGPCSHDGLCNYCIPMHQTSSGFRRRSKEQFPLNCFFCRLDFAALFRKAVTSSDPRHDIMGAVLASYYSRRNKMSEMMDHAVEHEGMTPLMLAAKHGSSNLDN